MAKVGGKGTTPSLEELWSSLPKEPPDQILPFLYLDSELKAMNATVLRPLKITHILNVTSECKNWLSDQKTSDDPGVSTTYVYARLGVLDVPSESLLAGYPFACSFIESVRLKNSAILVHCAGR